MLDDFEFVDNVIKKETEEEEQQQQQFS